MHLENTKINISEGNNFMKTTYKIFSDTHISWTTIKIDDTTKER
jgi:hypothetical protein